MRLKIIEEFSCPVCSSGTATVGTFTERVFINGDKFDVDGMACYNCDKCESVIVLEAQQAGNKEKLDHFLAVT